MIAARDHLLTLVGREIFTVTGRPNTVLSVGAADVVVATTKSPHGTAVPIKWVQNAFELLARDEEKKPFGVIVMAEGLAELLPSKYLEGIPRDDHGHISISHVNLGRMFARLVADAYKTASGRERKVTGLQLGYEARCAKPHAFDVMLGAQLGVGAYRALVEEGLNGVMVSVTGQLQLHYEPFDKLVDPQTLVTVVRYIEHGSDFHKLARFLET